MKWNLKIAYGWYLKYFFFSQLCELFSYKYFTVPSGAFIPVLCVSSPRSRGRTPMMSLFSMRKPAWPSGWPLWRGIDRWPGSARSQQCSDVAPQVTSHWRAHRPLEDRKSSVTSEWIPEWIPELGVLPQPPFQWHPSLFYSFIFYTGNTNELLMRSNLWRHDVSIKRREMKWTPLPLHQ